MAAMDEYLFMRLWSSRGTGHHLNETPTPSAGEALRVYVESLRHFVRVLIEFQWEAPCYSRHFPSNYRVSGSANTSPPGTSHCPTCQSYGGGRSEPLGDQTSGVAPGIIIATQEHVPRYRPRLLMYCTTPSGTRYQIGRP